MKKFIVTLMCIAALGAFAGCSKANDTPSSSEPEKEPKNYVEILKNAQDEETVKYNAIIGKGEDGKPTLVHNPSEITSEQMAGMIDMTLQAMGLSLEDIEDYALSASMMNIKVYGVAIVKPAEGKAEVVQASLQSFIDAKLKEFESYLVDQYEVAKSAQLKTMPTGEIVLVMSEDAESVFAKIEEALK